MSKKKLKKAKGKRSAARHAGKRQIPHPHEFRYMVGMPPEGSPAEEASETPQQEASEQAAGDTT